MSPLVQVQRSLQKQQRLQAARFLMARSEGSVDRLFSSSIPASAYRHDVSHQAMRDNWL
ncbi:hypothetical protein [Synechococcus sp. CC9616]|jgi:conjugal transfer/entry exclusion protein|uniref:hypothetical protein n=1 Tax=Synechococcus sp. CC9616 TaxID=110663 RepID=UPI0004B4A6F7|nr:hypothetical protein [Synechococcus sp. CC9616]